MELRYKTSKEKWEGLKRIALEELKDEELAKLCQEVVDWIEKKGDVSLNSEVSGEVKNVLDFYDAIYHGVRFPCPHCYHYARQCSKCPLKDDGISCCHAWVRVMHYVLGLV